MSKGGAENQSIGYNKGAVEEIRTQTNTMAQETGNIIIDAIKNNIINFVAERWYSEVAVTYFEEFKNVLKSKEDGITAIFQSFNAKMKRAGDEWAQTTQGEAPDMPPIETITLDLDVSNISNVDANQSRWIEEGLQTSILQPIEDARAEVKSYIENKAYEVDASLAFLGGGQAEAVNTAADQLDEAVNDILNFLVEGDESLVGAIERYNTEYTTQAETNVANFSDSNIPE